MEQYLLPVPTPGRRRSPPSSPAAAAAAAGPPHDPPSPSAVRRYHPQPDHLHHHHHHTACDVNNDVNSSSSSCCCLLPLDVIRSILSKLPVRSILRFRSVSSSWNQLISEPTFVESQLAEANKKPPRILVLTNHNFDSDPTNKIALHALAEGEEEEEEEPRRRRLLFERELASNESSTMMLPYDCDGLVLLYSKTDICVCNPATGETLHLPGFSHGRPLYKDPVQYLGFGLDPVTNLYKVVHFYFHSFDFSDPGETYWEVGLEVFTLGREFQSWRQIDDPTLCWFCPRHDSVSANGSLYWITNNFSIISFRLGDEGLRQLLPPPAAMVYPPQNFPPTRKGDTFIISGGGARLWYVKVNRDAITYDIWELTDERTHSWKSIHRICFQMLATEPILAIPVLVIRDGRYILLSNQEKLQLYDIVTKECKTMLTIEEEDDVNCVDGATLLCPSPYRETLVSMHVVPKSCY
ncbi:putative F-box protein [Iris pallida]|uniref:F-box protein n=1 Tax=Iris pallida TaxID=29817 RepID=A0AAX6HUV8_IRIPA|nr:putative F-box protein [Iris pallida]